MTGARGTPEVAVVIVHFGDPVPTLRCLASVLNDPSPVQRRVVVVDNSNTFPANASAGATVLRLPHNPGYGAAANAGAAALGEHLGEAIVVFNHDVELLPGYLGAVRGAVAVDGVGAAGGPLYLGRAGGPLWYAGGHINFLLGTVGQSRSPRRARREREVGYIPGAALAVARRAWDEIGGFDPAYFLYNEDVDLCLRLRRRGFRLRFVPAAAAVHHLGATTGSAGRSPLYLEHLSRTRLRPFHPFAYRLYLAGLHTLYVGARSLVRSLHGQAGREQARALLRGHLAALRELRSGSPRQGHDRA